MPRNTISIFILSILFLASSLYADDKRETLKFDDVLIAGPIESSLPVFSGDKISYSNLISFETIDVSDWLPSKGSPFNYSGKTLNWEKVKINDLEFEAPGNTIYLAAYVKTNRFVKAELKIESENLLNVYFDGSSIQTKTKASEEDLVKEISIENGKHIILVKVINPEAENDDWDIDMSLTISEPYSKDNVELTVYPEHVTSIKDLLDNPKLGNVSISYDGKIAAVQVSKRTKAKDADEKWFELYNVESGSLINTYRGGMSIDQVDWSPVSNQFAYTTSGDNGSNIWIADIDKNSNKPLIENIKDFSGFEWSPNGEYIVYTVTVKSDKRKKDLFQYENVDDRWPYANDKSYLYKVDLPSGTTAQLTAGDISSDVVSISPDGSKIIFSQTIHGVKERPYHNIKDYILDLYTMKCELLLEGNFLGNVKFSPDGKKLIVEGGSSLFDNLGVNVNEGVFPTDFDTQAYIYDLTTKKAEAITKNFDPSIGDSYWINDNTIYFNTTDRSFGHLFKYNVKQKTFSLVDLGAEVLHNISFSRKNNKAVFTASSSNIPKKAYTLDLNSSKINLLSFPESAEYDKVKLGIVKDWDFVSEAGRNVQGRIYFPPYFDEKAKYPVIVYYYGGTSPVERNFEGRYPFNVYTANGYVVYVLQPTGANGYGQNNSAVNVNDWGKVTAEEIIEGTKKFLKTHEFADPKRVGCMGASYGGFLTENLITKTDIFAAAISHAGISNLTSYWGVGYWGMWFNSVAAANSFPWNRKDIFVDHSAVYNADKITTPLLLLHGNIDTNVPLGESWTLYTALKLLGKDVEFIEINKQGHWIMQYEKRIKWTKTILAYFDKYLKDQPEWWNSLYN